MYKATQENAAPGTDAGSQQANGHNGEEHTANAGAENVTDAEFEEVK